ncbi:hypothetical protein VF14_15740 [Nostoc linckia z18]|uniref:Uncharacterized protein n=2 Tax=Nostoc linckia TaxID=92942 RepID=A0A9Q6EM01_NOSLI|nr:hypothetical protein [Nostoc linckia]PHK40712.1 hypothetical protein VF12_09495 [Nostoc linckia z15]PHK48281.1 hypothetical protein VF13_00815 [Nostoc linckia z16]PHJ60948.1 hypothetical protein VF02_21190 [Nostoc linckia z1]PHJ64684.1 hypothetical protein VF05_22400 [Nostoc linckia z3]PHJ71539.1 hypothetical protein VF03_20035 [Nostoc linckia z2]
MSQTSSKLLYSKGNFIEEFQKVSKKTSREIKAKRNELDFPLVRNPNLVIESGGASKLKKISNLENSESDRPIRLKNRIRHFLRDKWLKEKQERKKLRPRQTQHKKQKEKKQETG